MLTHASRDSSSAATSRPLTELLACPGTIEQRLGMATIRRDYAAGDVLFAQETPCDGLYLLLAGEFYRTAERRDKRLSLGAVRTGDLVELCAVLGDGNHTYSLTAASPASALVFPMQALEQAFVEYPPLRMHLLEELAREVSRCYGAVYLPRKTRHRQPKAND